MTEPQSIEDRNDEEDDEKDLDAIIRAGNDRHAAENYRRADLAALRGESIPLEDVIADAVNRSRPGAFWLEDLADHLADAARDAVGDAARVGYNRCETVQAARAYFEDIIGDAIETALGHAWTETHPDYVPLGNTMPDVGDVPTSWTDCTECEGCAE